MSRRQRQTYNCHSSFQKNYLTLFHIITHFILSQIRMLNFDSYWWFDMFYYPTFFIHQNVRTDLTYVWVQFKLKHLVFKWPITCPCNLKICSRSVITSRNHIKNVNTFGRTLGKLSLVVSLRIYLVVPAGVARRRSEWTGG